MLSLEQRVAMLEAHNFNPCGIDPHSIPEGWRIAEASDFDPAQHRGLRDDFFSAVNRQLRGWHTNLIEDLIEYTDREPHFEGCLKDVIKLDDLSGTLIIKDSTSIKKPRPPARPTR